MKHLSTEINIQASPERVWNVLTHFEAYPTWNPFIRSLKGNLLEGQKLTVTMKAPGTSGMTFNPTVLKVKEGSELRWKGQLMMKGIFDGEHIFELIGNSDGSTRFVQRENFNGILVPFFKKMLDQNTRMGFERMNERLKEICES